MKKRKIVFILASIILSLCLICGVAAIAMQMETSKPKTVSDYMNEFGGNPDIYAKILSMTDCAALQNEFNQAEQNLQEPGTPQYKWGLGYMKSADDRMKEIGCYR